MSILKLMRDRQMYKYGQRVGFRGGGGQIGGTADMSGGSNNNNEGNDNHGNNDYNFTGPADLGVTTRTVDKVTAPDVDRSGVGQFSTYGKNVMNQNLQGPSTLSKIGTGIGNYIKGGGTIGMVARGIGSLFGEPKSFEDQYGYTTDYQGTTGPSRVNNFGNNGGDGQDQMAMYNPNMLNVEGPVVEDETIETDDGEMEDFVHNYRGLNRTRQDKEGQLDPAIMEMISKLYT